MKSSLRIFSVVFLFVLQSQLGIAQDMVITYEDKYIESTVLNQSVKYSIILPEDYFKSEKKYPVVYLLHGLGGTNNSWLEYGRLSQYIETAMTQNKIQPMIYVMPEGYRTYYVNDYYGEFLYQDMFINELVPFIDSNYRTIPNNKNRATLGFSMGGFGALILPLKHPEVFSICVPLSISIRTDDQYMTEDAEEWDEQWGRLFGGMGLYGKDRITQYYKDNSPFHLLKKDNLNEYIDLKIFIDNGDDEQTLSKSNEELHMLLRDLNFKHEFRVRNGGHTFEYWRESLINGMNFIDDAFNEKPYRGDEKNDNNCSLNEIEISQNLVNETGYDVLLPKDYTTSTRNYPIIYFIGKFNDSTKASILDILSSQIKSNKFPPNISVFTDLKTPFDSIISTVKSKYRVRDGRRFQSVIGYKEEGLKALEKVLVSTEFTSCAIYDAPIDIEIFKSLNQRQLNSLERTWLYILTTDKSENYRSNGESHILLKERKIYHEYRVGEGKGGADWFLNELSEILDFSQKKIHY
ncbi:alpha/beta hydrolase [Winogradskyella sp. SM1960]|uniref:alpha/beta hydrolase n=1 Tax=Winogradskyella sp. SM1960 TaxID=2865955 RepID=UPI001CD1A52E|nr:alpha/beta hydrolase-fold protein [Winogradskyella sp. SM1960]